MLTANPNSVFQKRDLHVGGTGANAVSTLAAVTEPPLDFAASLLKSARQAARDAEYYVKGNPWAALAAVAVLGVAAGFLVARNQSR
jgi:ElaB/YqjD/DUF883 family membrane-anchored ribosome-binding protein